VINISKNIEKTPEMEKYEKETGKKAIWRSILTESYKRWLKGEKIYEQDKERITFLASEEDKRSWYEFMKKKEFTTFSKLIREAIAYYIESDIANLSNKTISDLSHDLKEPLTAIKGFTHLLIENYKDKLDWEILTKIKSVYDQSLILERIINDALVRGNKEEIDILIVDDDESTNKVLTDLFTFKGYSVKAVASGDDAFRVLQNTTPRILLLDIILSKMSGYEICKRIKSEEKFKDLLIFYITAVPRSEVEGKIDETGADGFFLKPFDYLEFDHLSDYF